MLITLSSELSLHVNCDLRSAKTKLVIMSINIRTAVIENMLGSQTVGFLRRRYPELLECHKDPSLKSYAMFVRQTALPRGYVGIQSRRSHEKKTMPFSEYWEGTGFYQCPVSGWGWSGELGIVSLSAVSMVHIRLVATGYRWIHPDVATRALDWTHPH